MPYLSSTEQYSNGNYWLRDPLRNKEAWTSMNPTVEIYLHNRHVTGAKNQYILLLNEGFRDIEANLKYSASIRFIVLHVSICNRLFNDGADLLSWLRYLRARSPDYLACLLLVGVYDIVASTVIEPNQNSQRDILLPPNLALALVTFGWMNEIC